MPYVKDEKRELVDQSIHQIIEYIEVKGDLNYVICELVGYFILKTGINYQNISDKIDTLPDAEDELRRRILHRYEDKAIIKNGDLSSFVKILEMINNR